MELNPYYETKLGKLYYGNAVDLFKIISNNSIDLTVTSPPYDNLRTYNGYSFDFETIAKELYRVTKDGGVVVWIVGDATENGSETCTSFKQALFFKEIGFNLHDTMIYKKKCYPFPPSNRYFPVMEYMFIFSKKIPKTTNLIRVKTIWRNDKKTTRQKDGSLKLMEYETGKVDRIKDNIWEYEVGYSKSSSDDIAFEHPATFPEQLVKDHIISWSNIDDLILDPFIGSGTTAKICEKLNRRWIGFEISKEYCELAKKRISKYQTTESTPIQNVGVL